MDKFNENTFMEKVLKEQEQKYWGAPVTQYGLFCEDPKDVKRFVDRVNSFNLNNLGTPITMNMLRVEKGDKDCPRPHVKFTLQFPSREAQRNFWSN